MSNTTGDLKPRGVALFVCVLVAFAGCNGSDQAPDARATPSFTGAGAAGVCAEQKGKTVVVTFETDVPNPRCVLVGGSQRLRLVNHFDRRVVATLGRLRLVLPAGGSATAKQTFDAYLRPGGYFLTTDMYNVEVRYDRPDR
jgi:hypothetical protein